MEKQKKWQFFLILTVIALTLYNILPTLLYYSKPLKSPVSETASLKIAANIEKRVKEIEIDSKEWIYSFCQLIHVNPKNIVAEGQKFVVSFNKSDEAYRFQKFLPRAGSLIPFPTAQLTV